MHVDSDEGIGAGQSNNLEASSSGRDEGTGGGQPGNDKASSFGRDEATGAWQSDNLGASSIGRDEGTGAGQSDNNLEASSIGRNEGTGAGQPDNLEASNSGRDEGTGGDQPQNDKTPSSGPCKRGDKEGGSGSGRTGGGHAAPVVGVYLSYMYTVHITNSTKSAVFLQAIDRPNCRRSAGNPHIEYIACE
mgnify:CR=1 FL=1